MSHVTIKISFFKMVNGTLFTINHQPNDFIKYVVYESKF